MAPFRFLDLPAEMRNSVYEVALHHDLCQGIHATPALLQTCSQVHKEAKDILYAESTFTIFVTVPPARKPRFALPKPAMDGDIKRLWEEPSSALQLFAAFPPQMLQVSKIYVSLDMGVHEANLAFANHFLYALVEFLNSDSQPHCLELGIGDTGDEDLQVLEKVLYPLQKLHSRMTIDLESPSHTSHEDLIKLQLASRNDSHFTHILDYLRLSGSNPHLKGAAVETSDRLAHDLLGEIKSWLSQKGHLSSKIDQGLHLNIIAATGILASSRNVRVSRIEQPPDWLVKCYEVAQLYYPQRPGLPAGRPFVFSQRIVEESFPSLRHLIGKIKGTQALH